MTEFSPFPSIESFHNVVRLTKSYPHLAKDPISYRGKIKLHGTNAGVKIHNGKVTAQSRTQFIDEKNDNAGFAKWVKSKESFFSSISTQEITIFGEWCGPGIMKGTAINQIDRKIFAIFCVVVGSGSEDDNAVIYEPETIRTLIPHDDDVYVLPWYGDRFTVDFYGDLATIVESLNKVVSQVEPEDPWVKSTFGISGTAEGVVYYPSVNEKCWRKLYSNFAFKAKGEKHKVVQTKESVQIDPEVVASVNEFVKLFVTEARVEQGISVVGADVKNTGNFLKWFNTDVQKESVAELEASGLTWSAVQGAVQNSARKAFMAAINRM